MVKKNWKYEKKKKKQHEWGHIESIRHWPYGYKIVRYLAIKEILPQWKRKWGKNYWKGIDISKRKKENHLFCVFFFFVQLPACVTIYNFTLFHCWFHFNLSNNGIMYCFYVLWCYFLLRLYGFSLLAFRFLPIPVRLAEIIHLAHSEHLLWWITHYKYFLLAIRYLLLRKVPMPKEWKPILFVLVSFYFSSSF